MLLWQGSIVEMDYGFFRVFGPYFIGKSLGTFKILIFGLWSFISHPYYWWRFIGKGLRLLPAQQAFFLFLILFCFVLQSYISFKLCFVLFNDFFKFKNIVHKYGDKDCPSS